MSRSDNDYDPQALTRPLVPDHEGNVTRQPSVLEFDGQAAFEQRIREQSAGFLLKKKLRKLRGQF